VSAVFAGDGSHRVPWLHPGSMNRRTDPSATGIRRSVATRSTTTRTKNAVRPSPVGRENWLLVGSTGAGARAAANMGLIATAHADDLGPQVRIMMGNTRLPPRTGTPFSRLSSRTGSRRADPRLVIPKDVAGGRRCRNSVGDLSLTSQLGSVGATTSDRLGRRSLWVRGPQRGRSTCLPGRSG
jgi:hypothetical protein